MAVVVIVSVDSGAGTTLFEGEELGPVPTAFVAVTVNEYESPFFNPDTLIGLSVPKAV
jgi:hypothetical protein